MWPLKSKKISVERIPARFPAKIERKTPKGKLTFDVHVGGYFIAPRNKVEFKPMSITVDGIKNMNIRHFYAEEIGEVNKYALSIVYPNLIGKGVR